MMAKNKQDKSIELLLSMLIASFSAIGNIVRWSQVFNATPDRSLNDRANGLNRE